MTVQEFYPDIDPSLSLDFANVKALDPRVTFTRASPAVYYDGKTFAKAEENLVLYSQELDNAYWSSLRITKSANSVAAPDGTTTAETFTETTETGTHRSTSQVVSVAASSDITVSVFLKNNTRQYAIFGCSSSATGNRWFAVAVDLSAGTITQTGAGASGTYTSSSITSVGNGWYRVAVTGRIGASTDVAFNIQMSDSGTPTILDFMAYSYTGSTANSFYAWGAQLEQRSAVTAYTPTTTQPITNYIPALQTAASGVARFDHDPITGESLGLLIEEQRTNLLLRSEEFQTTWSATRANIAANIVVSPDGTLTGDKLVENTDLNTHILAQSVAVTNGTSYTFSVYAKASERSRIQLRASYTDNIAVTFDLIAGTYIVVSGFPAATSITPVGNGWYRCAITGAAPSTSTFQFQIRIDNGATQSYQGDGYSGVYIWGAQLEEGSFPTSYIKTEASQVIRAADSAIISGTNFSSWYRQDEGTVYASAISAPGGSGQRVLRIDSSTNGTPYFMPNRSPNYNLDFNTGIGTRYNDAGFGSWAASTQARFAVAYANQDIAYSVNGQAARTSTGPVLSTPMSRITFGNQHGVANFLNGRISKVAYYPKRLTNAQLQALTK